MPGLPDYLRDMIGSNDDSVKKFLCVECGKTYSSFYVVKKHVVAKHSDLGKVNCLGRQCEGRFDNLDLMRNHAIYEHGEGTVVCPSPGCDVLIPSFNRSVLNLKYPFVNVCLFACNRE